MFLKWIQLMLPIICLTWLLRTYSLRFQITNLKKDFTLIQAALEIIYFVAGNYVK